MMEEPTIDHKQPPTTVREVGIHLIYMSKNMSDINKKLDEMSGTFAHRQELLDAIKQRKDDFRVLEDKQSADCQRITKLESFNNKIAYKIAGVAITMLVMMILGMYGLDKYFRG